MGRVPCSCHGSISMGMILVFGGKIGLYPSCLVLSTNLFLMLFDQVLTVLSVQSR